MATVSQLMAPCLSSASDDLFDRINPHALQLCLVTLLYSMQLMD